MLVLRWLRSLARFVLGVVLIAPVVALPLAVSLDRGPAGETRLSPHLFPLVLWLFDDFAWTCARNSLIFAVLVSLLSLALGGVAGVGCRLPAVLGARDSARPGDRLVGGVAGVSCAGTRGPLGCAATLAVAVFRYR